MFTRLTPFVTVLCVLAAALSLVACKPKSQSVSSQEQALLPMSQPGSQSTFNSVDITGVAYAQGFSFPDTQGNIRSLDQFKGKVVVVFFGFAQCPDVCPTTLAELAAVKAKLNEKQAGLGDKVQGIFITVDPERDTNEVLNAYMQAFDPSFIALRSTPDATRALANEFKVFYQAVQGPVEGAYTVDHTAASFVFDPEGNIRLFTRYQMGVDKWADDIAQLLQ